MDSMFHRGLDWILSFKLRNPKGFPDPDSDGKAVCLPEDEEGSFWIFLSKNAGGSLRILDSMTNPSGENRIKVFSLHNAQESRNKPSCGRGIGNLLAPPQWGHVNRLEMVPEFILF
jgi:hypothetical protein